MLLWQVATAATMSAAALEAMRMALHTLEETSSVSSKLGWHDSALLQSALKLAAVAAVSLLIGMPRDGDVRVNPVTLCRVHDTG